MPNRKPTILPVFEELLRQYPSHSTELIYKGPFQLLAAVILSAQCTDARVNQTTPALFAEFPTPEAMAAAPLPRIETLIHACGFYRMKAKALKEMAASLVEKFGGKVPHTMEALTSLRGVGRKTASVVMNQAFDLPAIAVDTHVKRVAHRLGWTRNTDPVKIETDLKKILPEKYWGPVNGLLILHGRRICKARKPLCGECSIRDNCAFFRRTRGSATM